MANIKWTTATEENADYFEVQRSTDGANFTTIGIVNAQGNSNQIVNYTFLDEGLNQVHSDVVYYRLREVDYDENDFYSNIQNLKLDPTLETKLVSNLYPNPFNNEVTLSLNSNNSELEILVTDLLGSIKYEKIIIGQNSQKYSLDLSELATGVYTITVISNGQKETYKTIKK